MEWDMNKRAASVSIAFDRMTPADVERVLAIEQAAYTSPWTRRMFESELWENPFSFAYVAREEEQRRIVGYVLFWMVYDELHLMNVAVDPAWRKRGIGEELVRFAINTGVGRGIRMATLEVRTSNLTAQSLYRKLGFHQVGVRRSYYREPREDALLLQCEFDGKPEEG
ncbi:MAG: ribosomal-protein-alanine N-acetyltransferase [Candidatus Manganitrophaceae bacterium]|nr:MAG: ribosomal-protein-alanine N-acetyltransferase [Candidatus Manganitrophaceae bacterium]